VIITDIPSPPVAGTDLPRLLTPTAGPDRARPEPAPRTGPELIAAVEAAGLRGRGGAAFPTGAKMRAVAAGTGAKVVVANGTEGEPLSDMDRVLLVTNPHAVLDGLAAAVAAVGAGRAILCVARGQAGLVDGLRRALAQRRDEVAVELAQSPDRYVTGQESALMAWLNGGDARPIFGPRPSERGVGGRPTLVDNVETLAHVGLIARRGPAWFRRLGLAEEPGSALVTVSGGVRDPGVYEIPIGYPLADLLRHVGTETIGAVLLGGYFGCWIDPGRVGTATLSNAGLAPLGARLGCGVISVVPERSCGLAEVAAVADWYAANSSGQCGACLFGLADIARAVRGLVTGEPGAEAAARRWTAMVRGRGACGLPDGAAMFVESALASLPAEIDAHRRGGCGRAYGRLLPVPPPGSFR
jgi:NADH:ubiquinone oxidoreductase subunit F (NADH-binding)